jgi:hypothetical protein
MKMQTPGSWPQTFPQHLWQESQESVSQTILWGLSCEAHCWDTVANSRHILVELLHMCLRVNQYLAVAGVSQEVPPCDTHL